MTVFLTSDVTRVYIKNIDGKSSAGQIELDCTLKSVCTMVPSATAATAGQSNQMPMCLERNKGVKACPLHTHLERERERLACSIRVQCRVHTGVSKCPAVTRGSGRMRMLSFFLLLAFCCPERSVFRAAVSVLLSFLAECVCLPTTRYDQLILFDHELQSSCFVCALAAAAARFASSVRGRQAAGGAAFCPPTAVYCRSDTPKSETN